MDAFILRFVEGEGLFFHPPSGLSIVSRCPPNADSLKDQNMSNTSLRLAALASLVATTVLAAENTNITTQLPEVVVTAARLPEGTVPLAQYPANVTVVTRPEIAASPAATLPELLRQEAGFTLFDSAGSFGAHLASFGLRGYGEKSGTLVMVDGVRMNDAGTGFFLWNSVPLQNIDRLEIIRGGASTIYGEGAAGGVINIVTKGPSNKPLSASASAEVGNLGYYSGRLELSGRTNQFSYLFSGNREEWAGWREGSNFRSWTALAKVAAETPAGRFTVSYTYHTEYSENPGQLTEAQFTANPRQPNPGAFGRFNFLDRLQRVSLDYAKEYAHGWDLSAKVYGQSYDTDFPDFTGVGRESGYGGVLQARWASDLFNRENTLTFGGEGIAQDFDQRFAGGAPTVHDSTLLSAFVRDELKIFSRTTLSGGLRFDHRRTFLDVPFPAFPAPPFTGYKENNVWSPNVSLSQELAEKTSAWFSFSQSYRLPSANDTVSGSPLFASNPGLVPLNARTVEVGVRLERFKMLSGSLTCYNSWVKNDIFTDPNLSFGFGANANADVLRRGVELSLKSQPADWVEFQGTTTYSDARFDGGTYNGSRLPLVPEWQLTAGVSLLPAKGWRWTIEDQYVTGQVRINDIGNVLPTTVYNVVNTRLSYTWKQVTAFAAVNNLLDRLYEQSPSTTLPGLGPISAMYSPAAGINFRIGASVSF